MKIHRHSKGRGLGEDLRESEVKTFLTEKVTGRERIEGFLSGSGKMWDPWKLLLSDSLLV